jgi:L-glyceraldehyde 3-phosphate reductase
MYTPFEERYAEMQYRRCGNSGLRLPVISLGLWHNFGYVDKLDTARSTIRKAFDLGITHFDLANNYGPPAGSAEENFRHILKMDLKPYRDELIISTKAGYYMWPGPYGEWGSRKYLIASCDQSLKRMGLNYVDIFYSHRPDPETPLEETMSALDTIVRQGKALYAGISNYDPEQTQKAARILKELGTPCLIHQPKYSMFVRNPEKGLLDVLGREEIGCIVFSPLAQGLLTDKYLTGIPDGSRAASSTSPFLNKENITAEIQTKLNKLNIVAKNRNQSLSQMAIAWLLKDLRVTSVLIGASSPEQLDNNAGAISNLSFSLSELTHIDKILNE